jgi:hypothetical protein
MTLKRCIPYCTVVYIHLSSGLFNFSFGSDNFGKIWAAYGKHEIQYTKYRISKYNYNYNFTCVYVYKSCAIKIG